MDICWQVQFCRQAATILGGWESWFWSRTGSLSSAGMARSNAAQDAIGGIWLGFLVGLIDTRTRIGERDLGTDNVRGIR
jgi:hypothetical protein